MKYKGIYRVLPVLDEVYHDLPRDNGGNISHEEVELYIACKYGNKITEYGKDQSNRMVLRAYIPSIGRGRNIKKALDAKGIPYTNYLETDEEIEFRFKAKDITPIAELMKVKTAGADISPFSTKNLPKSDVEIPTAEIERYKAITAEVQKADLLIIHRITSDFLSNILEKKYKKLEGKQFDLSTDMKKMKMSRMAKEYIYTKNMWDEYLDFLKKKINEFYNT
jgi:phosphopantothenoylcysteine synthetase/decarboxylase